MTTSYSGEIVLFGSDVERDDGTIPTIEDCEDARAPKRFSFPAEMGAVGVRKLCGGSIALLNGGHTYRFDTRQGFQAAFDLLPGLQQNIVDIAIGARHFLALTEEGKVYSFGANDQGQLGLGHTRAMDKPTLVEKFEQLDVRVVQLAAGELHSMALTASGHVYTWGSGLQSETGLSATSTAPNLTPRYLDLAEPVKAIASGAHFSAVLTRNGKVYFWGSGLSKRRQRLPLHVEFPEAQCTITSLAGGVGHIAVCDVKGRLWTWGHGPYGQLGQGLENSRLEAPKRVASVEGSRIVDVFCGNHYTVAVDSRGAVWTFGCANGGKLGHGDSQHQYEPRKITSIENLPVTQLGCGPDRLLCFIPTRVETISPHTAPSTGGITISLTGIGMYPTGDDYYVKFQLDDCAVVARATYDEQKVLVTCAMPSFPPEVVRAYSDPSLSPVAQVSVSLDGASYSNSLPLSIFTLPSAEVAQLLEPDNGPFQGGTRCVLRASYTNIPYDNIKVKFEVEQGGGSPSLAITVPGSYDWAKGELSFASPPFGPEVDREREWPSLSLARVSVSLDGQLFAPATNVFSYFGVQSTALVPAAVGLQGRSVQMKCSGLHMQSQIKVRFTVNGDPRKTFVKEAEFRLRSMLDAEEEEEGDPEVFSGDDGRGYLWILSPSFAQYGACNVSLAVCMNGCDFTEVATPLTVHAPQVTRLLPACGPVEGGTSVLLQGEHFYFTKQIAVRMENGPLSAQPVAVENKDEGKKGKKGEPDTPTAPATPQLPFGGEGTVDLVGEYRDRVGNPVVEVQAPAAAHAGVTHLFAAFDPNENAFSKTPLGFTYYGPPCVLGADPVGVACVGGTVVELTGTGFIQSETMAVRLVEVLEEEAPAGKGKKAPGKKAKKEPEPADAAETPKEAPVRASVVVKASFKDNTPVAGETVEPAKGKAKGKSKAPAVDANAPSITFVAPPLSMLLVGKKQPAEVEEGQVPGAGMKVEVELSLNGQQFVSTGVKLTFEAATNTGKKPTTGKKKK